MKLQIITTDGKSTDIPIEKIESIRISEMNTIGQSIINSVIANLGLPPSFATSMGAYMPTETKQEPKADNPPIEVVDAVEQAIAPEPEAPIIEDASVVEEVMMDSIVGEVMTDASVVQSDTVDVVPSEPVVEVPKVITEVEVPQSVGKACDDFIADLLAPKVLQTAPTMTVTAPVEVAVNKVTSTPNRVGEAKPKVIQLNSSMVEI